jgi:hypothetical protein
MFILNEEVAKLRYVLHTTGTSTVSALDLAGHVFTTHRRTNSIPVKYPGIQSAHQLLLLVLFLGYPTETEIYLATHLPVPTLRRNVDHGVDKKIVPYILC